MADLSKIKLNGTEYDLKDAVTRNNLIEIIEIRKDEMDSSSSITLDESYTFNSFFQEHKKIALLIDYYNSDRSYENAKVLYFMSPESCLRNTSGRLVFMSTQGDYYQFSFSSGESRSPIVLSYYQAAEIPTLEPMSNVEDMLTSFGLNANANLTSATVPATLDSAVAL